MACRMGWGGPGLEGGEERGALGLVHVPQGEAEEG